MARCGRCGRNTGLSARVYGGVTLGQSCVKIAIKREALRAHGTNPRLIQDTENEQFFTVSEESAVYCPQPPVACVRCPHFYETECPLEKKCGNGHL